MSDAVMNVFYYYDNLKKLRVKDFKHLKKLNFPYTISLISRTILVATKGITGTFFNYFMPFL